MLLTMISGDDINDLNKKKKVQGMRTIGLGRPSN